MKTRLHKFGYTVKMKKAALKFYKHVIDYDPGLEKFKQGFKSVMALCFTLLLIFPWVSPLGLVFGSLACVFTGLMHAGDTLRQQKLHMLAAVFYFPAAIALGLSLQGHFWIANIILVLMSFLGFYLAKFGSCFRLYPVMGAVFYLLSINFMLPSILAKFEVVAAVFIGGSVMFVVYFYVWPQNPTAELRQHLESIFNRCILCIEDLRIGVSLKKSSEYYESIEPVFNDLEQRLNQELQLLDRATNEQKIAMETFIVKQYALYMLFYMFLTWLKELSHSQERFDETHSKWIVVVFSTLVAALLRLKQLYYAPSDESVLSVEFKNAVQAFKAAVFTGSKISDSCFIYYSYLAFGFERAGVLLEIIQKQLEELKLSPPDKTEAS